MIEQADLERIMADHPDLCTFGFGPSVDFNKERKALREALHEVRLCCEWLSLCKRRKTINRAWQSYYMKHRVEWYFRPNEVSNGAFIVAAIYLGIPFKRDRNVIYLAITDELPEKKRSAG